MTGASNVTGNCTDLAKAAAFAHRHGLLLIVDAAQTAGAQSIDVQALGVDVLCFTGIRLYWGRRHRRAVCASGCADRAPCSGRQRRAQL